jgi:cell division protein FtsW
MSRRGPDRLVVLATLGLMAAGVVMVYSASAVQAAQSHGDARHYLDRQILYVGAGLALMAVCSRVPPRLLHRLALPLYGLAVLALLLVLVPEAGLKIGGARRWLGVGEIRVQPSEFARIAVILVLSRLLALRIRRGEVGCMRLTAFPALVLAGLAGGLILFEPDLDTVVALGAVAFALLFLAGVPLRQLGTVLAVLLLVLTLLVSTAGYRRTRMLAFLDPAADPSGSGYQVRQSLLAVGLGGLTGVGFGESRQKLFYLPAAHTDFIFAVLTEETGLAGALLVLGLAGLLLWRGLAIARRQQEPFCTLLAAGLTTAFGLGTLINLGAVLSLLPPTGIALPLVSYGGSSLLSQAVSIGFLLSLSRSAETEGEAAQRPYARGPAPMRRPAR